MVNLKISEMNSLEVRYLLDLYGWLISKVFIIVVYSNKLFQFLARILV